ncbi:MAG: MarR family transcriptional regulator [Pseudomonadota bacterium]
MRSSDTSVVDGAIFQDIARLRVFCFHTVMGEGELTSTQSLVILALNGDEGCKQGDLARALGIRPVTLGGVVDRMEAKAWIERRADKDDRRANRIYLTDEGRALVQRVQHCLDQVNEVALKDVPARKLNEFFKVLTQIQRNLREFQIDVDK